ncbi:hypothetical protein ES703_117099 [subsurface metagenome]
MSRPDTYCFEGKAGGLRERNCCYTVARINKRIWERIQLKKLCASVISVRDKRRLSLIKSQTETCPLLEVKENDVREAANGQHSC